MKIQVFYCYFKMVDLRFLFLQGLQHIGIPAFPDSWAKISQQY
jgi:hypothetical protein